LWLEVLDEMGIDLSLMSAAEMDAMVTYGMLLKYQLHKEQELLDKAYKYIREH